MVSSHEGGLLFLHIVALQLPRSDLVRCSRLNLFRRGDAKIPRGLPQASPGEPLCSWEFSVEQKRGALIPVRYVKQFIDTPSRFSSATSAVCGGSGGNIVLRCVL